MMAVYYVLRSETRACAEVCFWKTPGYTTVILMVKSQLIGCAYVARIYQLSYFYMYKTTLENEDSFSINTPSCPKIRAYKFRSFCLMYIYYVHSCATIGCDCRDCIDTWAEMERVGGQLCEHIWAYMYVVFVQSSWTWPWYEAVK